MPVTSPPKEDIKVENSPFPHPISKNYGLLVSLQIKEIIGSYTRNLANNVSESPR